MQAQTVSKSEARANCGTVRSRATGFFFSLEVCLSHHNQHTCSLVCRDANEVMLQTWVALQIHRHLCQQHIYAIKMSGGMGASNSVSALTRSPSCLSEDDVLAKASVLGLDVVFFESDVDKGRHFVLVVAIVHDNDR